MLGCFAWCPPNGPFSGLAALSRICLPVWARKADCTSCGARGWHRKFLYPVIQEPRSWWDAPEPPLAFPRRRRPGRGGPLEFHRGVPQDFSKCQLQPPSSWGRKPPGPGAQHPMWGQRPLICNNMHTLHQMPLHLPMPHTRLAIDQRWSLSFQHHSGILNSTTGPGDTPGPSTPDFTPPPVWCRLRGPEAYT